MATNRPRRAARAEPLGQPANLVAALDAIRRIVQALRLSSRRAERRVGLSGAQLFVLHSLAEAPAESLNDLAARTFTHQSSVSVVVERLVRRRLVTRARSAQDGRRITLTLTPAGRALLRSAPETAQERLIAALRQLSTRERRTLTRGLQKLVRAMPVTPGLPPLFFAEGAHASARHGTATGRRASRLRSRPGDR